MCIRRKALEVFQSQIKEPIIIQYRSVDELVFPLVLLDSVLFISPFHILSDDFIARNLITWVLIRTSPAGACQGCNFGKLYSLHFFAINAFSVLSTPAVET